MAPPHDHTKKGPHHRPHPEWMLNIEKEDQKLREFGATLSQIGQRLCEAGKVRIQDTDISPAAICRTVIRYERAPRGEMKLHIEVEWECENGAIAPTEPGPIKIE